MKNKRVRYFAVVLLVIALGILSRQSAVIPLFFGDLLYAIMIYFGTRMLFLKLPEAKIALVSLLVCYAIEISQCCQSGWISEIRATQLGHYVLGQGFLWSDMAAYSFGILIAFWMNKKQIV